MCQPYFLAALTLILALIRNHASWNDIRYARTCAACQWIFTAMQCNVGCAACPSSIARPPCLCRGERVWPSTHGTCSSEALRLSMLIADSWITLTCKGPTKDLCQFVPIASMGVISLQSPSSNLHRSEVKFSLSHFTSKILKAFLSFKKITNFCAQFSCTLSFHFEVVDVEGKLSVNSISKQSI